MSKLLPANRVVLILHGAIVVLTALGIFIAAIDKSLPQKWQVTAVAIGGIVGALAAGTVAVNKFLTGSQQFDALQAQYGSQNTVNTVNTPGAATLTVTLPDSARKPDPPEGMVEMGSVPTPTPDQGTPAPPPVASV